MSGLVHALGRHRFVTAAAALVAVATVAVGNGTRRDERRDGVEARRHDHRALGR